MLALLLLLTLDQQAVTCSDLAACRSAAIEAQASKDYEAFHDLAWAAYRHGPNNDPELMLLVARAQSLSGRPGDALVMLERISALGASTDAATSEDFTRVRALPRWEEVAARFSEAVTPATGPPASPNKDPDRPPTDPAPPANAPAPPAKAAAPTEKTPPVKEPAAPAGKAKANEPSALAKKPAAVAKAPAAPAAKRDASAPLAFTTLLTPSALVHDAVSRRFIIADRTARRIAVVDETTGQVATLVGALGALGEIGGIAIDPRQGDLWVVTSTDEGTVLHRMQLISGRVLSTVALAAIEQRVVAMAFAPGSGLVVADAAGTVWRIREGGGSEKLAALEYVPRAFAADPAGRLYVSGGAPRLARFSLAPAMRKTGVIDVAPSFPAGAPFVVAGNRLHFIVPVEGSFEIRSIPLK